MSRWFRMYDEVLDDPKAQKLPGDLFKAWVNLLCLACRNGGVIPDADVPFALRVSGKQASTIIDRLTKAGLIDVTADEMKPHAWEKRQHKSDVSNDRVARYRERQRNAECNVTGNAIVTSPRARATEADTETETDVARADAVIVSLRTALTRAFEAANSPNPIDTARAAVWISQGYRPDLCIAVVSEGLSRKKSISSLSYFDNAIREAHQKVAPPTAASAPAVLVADEARWKLRLDELRQGSPWRDQWGPSIGKPGCLVPKPLADEYIAWCRARKIEVAA